MLFHEVYKERDRFSLNLDKIAPDLVCVEASNIAKYYYVDTDKEMWKLPDDFPNIMPPWPYTWVEHVTPPVCNSSVHGILSMPILTVGALVVCYKLDDEAVEKVAATIQGVDPNDFQAWSKAVVGYLAVLSLDDPGLRELIAREATTPEGQKRLLLSLWQQPELRTLLLSRTQQGVAMNDYGRGNYVLELCYFMKHKGRVTMLPFRDIYHCDAQGGIVMVGNGSTPYLRSFNRFLPQEQMDVLGRSNLHHVPLLTFSFCHCRNVALAPIEPTFVDRRREAKHKIPKVKAYTLKITPTIAKQGRTSATSLLEIKRALHICRGHFATYTEDKPLFGRHTGTFWRSMHTRGQASQGVVVKDYMMGEECVN